MKKFLVLLLAIFTCFNAEAIPIAHSALPTANADRRQRERLAKEKQHEEDFHHGDLVYEVVGDKNEFTLRDSVPSIETYEIQRCYYEIDPDKCTIETRTVLKSLRVATEKEIPAYKRYCYFIISLFGLIAIGLVILVIFIIYQSFGGKKKLSINYTEGLYYE